MKAKLLSFTLFCFTMVGLYAQTVTRTENFSNYGGNATYAGINVGENQIVWSLTDAAQGTLNGNAVILTTKTSKAEVNIPFGITGTLSFTTSSSEAQGSTITVSIDGTPQGSPIDIISGTETHNVTITSPQNANFTLTIANTDNAANRSVTIDDVTWTGYTSIREIQYTTVPGINGTYPSPVVGNSYTVYGTVTGVKAGAGYYIYDADGEWNGIFVSDASISPAVLDIVSVTGVVTENGGRTEIAASSASIIDPGAGIEPVATMIYTPLAEKDESVVSYITFSRYAAGTAGNFYMNIGFNAPLTPIKVDNDLYTMADPNVNNFYQIVGPVNYAGAEFSISPRDVADVTDEGIITGIGESVVATPTIATGINSIVVESGNVFSIQVYNLAGQRIKDLNGLEGRNEISLAKGVYVVKVNTANTTATEKVLVK